MEELYKQYGECMFQLEVLQAKANQLKQQMVQQHNQATVPTEGKEGAPMAE